MHTSFDRMVHDISDITILTDMKIYISFHSEKDHRGPRAHREDLVLTLDRIVDSDMYTSKQLILTRVKQRRTDLIS